MPKLALSLPERVHSLHSTALLRGDVDRGGGQRRVPKVLLRDLDRHPAGDRMAGMRVPHPMRAGLRESLRALRVALPSQHAGAVIEEPLDLVVERRRGDPLPRVDGLSRAQPRCRRTNNLRI